MLALVSAAIFFFTKGMMIGRLGAASDPGGLLAGAMADVLAIGRTSAWPDDPADTGEVCGKPILVAVASGEYVSSLAPAFAWPVPSRSEEVLRWRE